MLALLMAAGARAETFDPLALVPDSVPEAAPREATGLRLEVWQQYFEAGGRQSGAGRSQQRLLLDWRREWSLGQRTRVGVSDRVEQVFGDARAETRNALRELYLNHDLSASWFVDVGRINWRNGVGSGFNPTDYLRRGTVMEQGSLDPRALRENRLGTVMLRQQWIGGAGSVQLALIPSLRRHDSDAATAPGWARSNAARAALLKVSPALGARSSVDLLAYHRVGEAAEFGVNLTHLLGDAVVLHAELSSGRSPATRPSGRGRHHQHALGATWSTRRGPVVSAELQRDGELGTRAAFVRVGWDRAFGASDVDLSAFVRRDLIGRGRMWQGELRWHVNARHGVVVLVGDVVAPPDAAPGRYATLSWQYHF